MDYKHMYFYLFNAITDALGALLRGDIEAAADILRQAQQRMEEVYIEAEE